VRPHLTSDLKGKGPTTTFPLDGAD
jgi:hypothetical protein